MTENRSRHTRSASVNEEGEKEQSIRAQLFASSSPRISRSLNTSSNGVGRDKENGKESSKEGSGPSFSGHIIPLDLSANIAPTHPALSLRARASLTNSSEVASSSPSILHAFSIYIYIYIRENEMAQTQMGTQQALHLLMEVVEVERMEYRARTRVLQVPRSGVNVTSTTTSPPPTPHPIPLPPYHPYALPPRRLRRRLIMVLRLHMTRKQRHQ